MVHEPGQVFEIPPEPVELLGRAINHNALFHLDAFTPWHARDRADPATSGRISTQSAINGAPPSDRPRQETARKRKQKRTKTFAPESHRRDRGRSHSGSDALRSPEVDTVVLCLWSLQILPALVGDRSVVGRCHTLSSDVP